jgi:hypothetical protein
MVDSLKINNVSEMLILGKVTDDAWNQWAY